MVGRWDGGTARVIGSSPDMQHFARGSAEEEGEILGLSGTRISPQPHPAVCAWTALPVSLREHDTVIRTL